MRPTVRWVTAFLDRPATDFDATVAFWAAVTGTTRSAVRGADGEFATLVPADGDAYVRVQRVGEGGGTHLDLHVDDPERAVTAARALGGTVVADLVVPVIASPGGLRVCLVAGPDAVEPTRPAPVTIDGAGETRLDQVAIDVPADRYVEECRFWAALTGWEHREGRMAEFSSLVRPDPLPLRVMFQRLGPDAPQTQTTAHLDFACADIDAAVAAHRGRGAEVVAAHRYWTTLRDPAGFAYCLTRRQPVTGLLA